MREKLIAALALAGLYQLTAFKDVCRASCVAPAQFLVAHWRRGRGGAFSLGCRHGLYCLGCCWALMLLLFAGGVMNLAVVIGIGVVVGTVYVALRFRMKPGEDPMPKQTHGNTVLEIGWTILPALILAGIAVGTVMTIINDPVYLTEPFVRTTDYELALNQRVPPYPCGIVQEIDREKGKVPHFLPGTNPFMDEFRNKYGLPLDAVLGGPETMYPEYMDKLKAARK